MSSTVDSKITLVSSDDEVFEVDRAVAEESQTIRDLLADICVGGKVPLPNVSSKILAKVIEYAKKHVEYKAKTDGSSVNNAAAAAAASVDEDLKNWDAEFVKVDQAILFNLILAANYLNIKGLLDLTCQSVADMMKGKTAEEIRETLNIKNDFSPDEEAEVLRENQWAFE